MWKVVSSLSLAASIVAAVMLARYGFHLGSFVAPLQLVLDSYEAFMRFLFGWAEPCLRNALVVVHHWTDWNLSLYPHWKHVLVPMWLYFGVVTKAFWTKPTFSPALGGLAALTAWGGLVALAVSFAAGAVPLEESESNMLVAALPVVGVVLYQLGFGVWIATFTPAEIGGWRQRFRMFAPGPLFGPGTFGFRAVGVIVLILLLGTQADKLPFLKTLPSPGLVLLAILVVFLALAWIRQGAIGAKHNYKREDISWWRMFTRSINFRIGVLMLQAIGGAIAFILGNAGLKLAGLS